MDLSKLSFLLRKILKSDSKIHDLVSVIISLLFRERNIFCSTSIRFINEGAMKCKGIFLLGVFSNKVNLDSNQKGCFRVSKGGVVQMGEHVRMARGIKTYVRGNLIVGDSTYFNPNCLVIAHRHVQIGSNCAISWDVQIIDDDMHLITNNNADSNDFNSSTTSSIIIGDNVWIGARATILKGTNIGNGSVIGAGSVVKGNVPPNSIFAGNPSKLIKENVSWQ